MKNKQLKILLSAPRGFCAGVERAIEIVEKSIQKYGAPVYVRHEIVHNKYVVDDLKNKGAVFVEELEEIKDKSRPVIFSAHGVPKKIPDDAKNYKMTYVDATCPLVSKVHRDFEKLMNEVGIKIIKGNEVAKIISKNNKITGVQLNNNNNIDADNIICNADPPAVYEKLLDGKSNNSVLFKWKKNRMEYSMGLFVYYFGTKKIYQNVEHHTIKFGNKYKEHLDDIFNKIKK